MNLEEPQRALTELESMIGHRFKNRALLVDALTHPSYVNEKPEVSNDNQRMEFFGDSVLGLVIAQRLYEEFPDFDEGALSSGLSSLVREEALAEIARKIDLGSFVRMGRGEAISGGRDRASLLADAYEALLAAVYLDGGIDAATAVVGRLHADAIDLYRARRSTQDAKSQLQKIVQSAKSAPPAYRIVHESGPAHERVFVAEVFIDGDGVAIGQGRTKKGAEQAAAHAALEILSDSTD